jgi:glycine cleavage system transcriptional repressor
VVKRYLVAVTGPNRPGILAAVGNAIAELGGDIHEVRQVSLQGFFSMLLAVDFPLHRDPGVISGHLGDVCKAFSADISIKDPEIELWDEEPSEGARHFLTLSGHNTPGVASRISARLARDGIDIADSYGIRHDDGTFTLSLELKVPQNVNVATLERDLSGLVDDGLTIRVWSDAEAPVEEIPPPMRASPVKP